MKSVLLFYDTTADKIDRTHALAFATHLQYINYYLSVLQMQPNSPKIYIQQRT